MSTQNARFQPVILVIDGKRLECPCGALATFVNVKLSDVGTMEEVCVFCHDCYCKDQEMQPVSGVDVLRKLLANEQDIKSIEQLDSGWIVRDEDAS